MLIANGSIRDPAQLRPLYRATTTRQYVDAATGSDAAVGDIATPLVTLKEAVDRVPENYVGLYEIQCVGAGPYTLPVHHPKSGVGGVLAVYADRSTPVVTNAVPSFTVEPDRHAQHTDPNFGAHPDFIDGTHWADIDLSAFGFTVQSFPAICKGSIGPSLTLVAGTTVSVPTAVYAHVTQLSIPADYIGGSIETNPGILGGPNYFGFIKTVDASSRISGLAFDGGVYSTGNWRFEKCSLGGYYDGPLNGSFTTVDCDIFGFHLGASFSNNFLVGGSNYPNIARSLLDNTVIIQPNTNIRFFNQVDIDIGVGLDCGPNTTVGIGGNGISANGVRMIRTKGHVVDSLSPTVGMLGSVTGNLVELVDGGRMSEILSARWALVTPAGSEIVVGANPGTTMLLAAAGTNDLGAATPQGCFSS